MNFFDILTMLGGLALFLYGMRMMSSGLKDSSSGTLKKAMELVTNNPIKAFLLGVFVTAVIQSSTATIVITSGLVGAGIISLHQSLGIIIGANVGTTVTGQIIRLLDIDSSATEWLEIFKPSSLAPIALILGIVLIMGLKFKNSKTIGDIAMGFGILFTGLLTMTGAVDSLADTGIFETLFTGLGDNPFLGYLAGAGVAFILQSSSAAVGILQALSASGVLTFNAIYALIVGIYLGDCVTTAIVCWIGARPDAKRVGIVNILFNLSKTALVLIVVVLLHQFGLLDWIWTDTVTSGTIANTNTIFNLGCAIALFPLLRLFEKLSYYIVREKPSSANPYQESISSLSPAFFNTPALALRSCYRLLLTMFYASRENIEDAFSLLRNYDDASFEAIQEKETNIDLMTDHVSNYLVSLASHLTVPYHIQILNHYYKVVSEFERLGDHATNIAEKAADLHEKKIEFSEAALKELSILQDLIFRILSETEETFKRRDVDAAYRIEPLEEVVDDLVEALKKSHLARLSRGECSVYAGSAFMDLLADIERISDICSNVGLATVTRVNPELTSQSHDYVNLLHSGEDQSFNALYDKAHKEYFDQLESLPTFTAF